MENCYRLLAGREQTDSFQRGRGWWGWVKRAKGLSKNKKKFTDTDNSRVITRGKGGWEEIEESKGGINGD